MKLEHMREWIKSAYPNKTWSDKVDKMPDAQIIRVYKDLVQRGKIRGA